MEFSNHIAHGGGAPVPGAIYPLLRNTHTAPRAEESKPQITLWTPRDKRNDAYKRWEKSRASAVKQNGLRLAADFPPPTITELRALLPNASSAQLQKRFQEALHEYQQLNTQYFDLVRPSLTIYNDRRHWEDDHDTVETFSVAAPDGRIISDGAGLVEWARGFTNVTSLDDQGNLRLALTTTKVPKGHTV